MFAAKNQKLIVGVLSLETIYILKMFEQKSETNYSKLKQILALLDCEGLQNF